MSVRKEDLRAGACKPAESGSPPLSGGDIAPYLEALPDWELQDNQIVRTYSFKDYYRTLSFVNAVAWIANTEDHHPDIAFDYKTCTVRYSTHSVGGITENDFICAAKIDALVE